MAQVLYRFLCVLVACGTHVAFGNKYNVSVVTPAGTFIGVQEDINIDNNMVKMAKFLGIPFAEPPTGQRRFRKPVMKAKMLHPMVTNSFGPDCLQLQTSNSSRPWSEDCLFLNVYVPELPSSSPLPVMIWIYGGAYAAGTSSIYNAELLAARGKVVIVTINYRLGPIGFLNFGGGRESNFGLWDQHLAIQWVQKNIQAFGGDKSRVTIFGESAGSGSVIYQGLYPGNQGLFQRIIGESGTASSPWSETENHLVEADRFAASLGCTLNNTDDVLDCLRKVPSDTINDWINNVTNGFRVPYPFAPSVDGDFVKVSPKDTLNPNIYVDSPARRVFRTFELLMGTNAAEGAGSIHPVFGVESDPNKFLPNKTLFDDLLVPLAISKKKIGGDYEITKEFLIQAYTNWSSPNDPYEIRQNFVDMHSDFGFVIPCLQTLDVYAQKSNKSAFMYYFTAEPTVHLIPIASWIKSSNHGDELRYVFGNHIPITPTNGTSTKYEEWEKELSKSFMTMWSNFAKTGNPNTPNAIGVDWKPYSNIDRGYLEIGKFMNVTANKQHLIADKYHLWNSLRPAVEHTLEEKCSLVNSGVEGIQIVNGTNKYSGRVMLRYKGIWRSVCSSTFDQKDAIVICRMLKFQHPETARAFVKSEFGRGTCSSLLTDMHCNGTETILNQCKATYSTACCLHNEYAGVDCCPSCDGAPSFVG